MGYVVCVFEHIIIGFLRRVAGRSFLHLDLKRDLHHIPYKGLFLGIIDLHRRDLRKLYLGSVHKSICSEIIFRSLDGLLSKDLLPVFIEIIPFSIPGDPAVDGCGVITHYIMLVNDRTLLF